jgi:hypothetical protein
VLYLNKYILISMNEFGLKYKDHFICLDKLPSESDNDIYIRLWFIAKFMKRCNFDDLTIFSKYYLNVEKYKNTYPEVIHQELSKIIS